MTPDIRKLRSLTMSTETVPMGAVVVRSFTP
jgi:hypothetical protein